MHYSTSLTVLTTNTSSSPATSTLKLASGVLDHASIIFPAGCQWLVHFQAFIGSDQILPTNLGGDYAQEDYAVEAGLYVPVGFGYNTLTLRGWSSDAKKDHTLQVLLHVKGDDEPKEADMLIAMAEAISNMAEVIKGWF